MSHHAAATLEDAEQTFGRWLQARLALELADPDAEEDEANWDLIDRAEVSIFNSSLQSPRLAEMRLWMCLSHTLHDAQDHLDIAKSDLPAIVLRSNGLNWNERLLVQALCALTGTPISPAKVPLAWDAEA